MMRKTPMKRSAPMKRTRIRPKKRSQESDERIYSSVERAEFVESLPCCGCDVEGWSVNAHVGTEGKGLSRKANADQIAPLCSSRIGAVGCHELFDTHHAPFDTDEARARIVGYAAITEARWRVYCEEAA